MKMSIIFTLIDSYLLFLATPEVFRGFFVAN